MAPPPDRGGGGAGVRRRPDAQAARDAVIGFCAAWARRDLDALLRGLSNDVVYQNVPRPPMIGKAAAAAFIGPIVAGTTRIDFEVLAIAASPDGRRVLTERMDRLHYPAGVIEIPLMGVFELDRQGLITAWRDYADSAHLAAQMARLAGPPEGEAGGSAPQGGPPAGSP